MRRLCCEPPSPVFVMLGFVLIGTILPFRPGGGGLCSAESRSSRSFQSQIVSIITDIPICSKSAAGPRLKVVEPDRYRAPRRLSIANLTLLMRNCPTGPSAMATRTCIGEFARIASVISFKTFFPANPVSMLRTAVLGPPCLGPPCLGPPSTWNHRTEICQFHDSYYCYY